MPKNKGISALVLSKMGVYHILPPGALLPEFSAHGVHLKEKRKPCKIAQNTALCGI